MPARPILLNQYREFLAALGDVLVAAGDRA